jgi:hypothetical protein
MLEKEQIELMGQRIQRFNEFVMAQDIYKQPLGLFSGRMGLCIYFFHQHKITLNIKYKNYAEKILISIYKQIHVELSTDIEDGLIGICYGIIYLIEQGFIEGKINHILKDLDDKIFNRLYFSLLNLHPHLYIEEHLRIISYSIYFCKRIQDPNLKSDEKVVFEQIVIKSINAIDTTLRDFQTYEHKPFSPFKYFPSYYLILLSNVYELGFYSYKVKKICDELSEDILSLFPQSQSYRLLLSYAMNKINIFYLSPEWSTHIDMLKSKTDIHYILKNEFPNKNIWIHNGICGFYILLKEYGLLTDDNSRILFNKIMSSNHWTDLYLDNQTKLLPSAGLMSGLSGVILICQDIVNQNKLFSL